MEQRIEKGKGQPANKDRLALLSQHETAGAGLHGRRPKRGEWIMSRYFLLFGSGFLALALSAPWVLAQKSIVPDRARAAVSNNVTNPTISPYSGFPYGMAYFYGLPYSGGYSYTPSLYPTYTPGYYPTPGSYYSAYYHPSGDLNLQTDAPVVPEAPPPAVPGQPVRDDSAHLLVTVPPNSQLWFNGIPTQQGGTQRAFITPPLTPGRDYSYDIKARWIANGRAVEEQRTIHVTAGQRSSIDLTQPAPGTTVRVP
jgi:uncharacterized protein (TIGR03000 family)